MFVVIVIAMIAGTLVVADVSGNKDAVNHKIEQITKKK